MQKRNLKVTKEGHEKMKSKVDVSVACYPILIARQNLVMAAISASVKVCSLASPAQFFPSSNFLLSDIM